MHLWRSLRNELRPKRVYGSYYVYVYIYRYIDIYRCLIGIRYKAHVGLSVGGLEIRAGWFPSQLLGLYYRGLNNQKGVLGHIILTRNPLNPKPTALPGLLIMISL